MLTKDELQKIQNKNVFVYDSNISEIKELLGFEEKYKINTVEVFYSDVINDDFKNWKRKFSKFIYNNQNFCLINKKKKIDYLTVPRRYYTDKIVNYLDALSAYIKRNPNVIFLITNTANRYTKIIELCNERNILCLLLSNNLEDKYLDYSNLFVQITDNPSETAKKMKIKMIQHIEDEIF